MSLEGSSETARSWGEEHRLFLQNHNPRLHNSLQASGELDDHVHSIGAAEQETHVMLQKMRETGDLPYGERVRKLEATRLAMQEIIRHDFINWPLPG